MAKKLARSRSSRPARSDAAAKDDDNLWDVDERRGVLLFRANIRGTATADQLRKAMRDPRGIRAWLNVRRKKASAEEEALIWRALFTLYGIPEGEYQWLAGRLAREQFRRCQALWKPHGGGRSKKWQADRAERKRKLREQFESYRREISNELQRARLFMKDQRYKEACAAAGFTSPKAFVQAMKK
jgi:hypothetical protein